MIDCHEAQGIVTIRLARPDKANALTAPMLEALIGHVAGARGARAVIVTGTGAVFSAGADLAQARAGLATSPLWETLSGAIASLPCPSIAALNGTAAGGALGMVLACDLRIAVPGSEIFYPVMKRGFLPQPSDPARLTALVGPARAALILLAGARIGTEEALRIGLIERIAASDTLLQTAQALCADACGASPGHAAAIKAMLRGGAAP
ncbi:enoyl-CoA hydratase/isomerase family protein [Profundibacterium mesophilum]|uniref:Enoyl-CoA hydratase n=1 Tax=Profundibacterium mesophilum KAUST100406-0324 TaxID=1037889 RepID=A0A921NVB9_9RHOB|nr:enoyl-CoA hydratase/isomerase family protein [Profundibacterium mesophilum]KAF0675474.1 Enoyl-CoA hydratase [Profundibacterium mesophilum KAUST100406-0324]